MAIRNTAASAVLGLLFLSLVTIYLLIPQNNLVTFLCILILIVSLMVAQSRRWRDIAVMALFAALVSLVAASIFGRVRFGGVGAVLVPAVWGLILFGIFSWTQRNLLPVSKDRTILIRNRYSGAVHAAEGPIAPPLIPAIESKLAVIPLYELSERVRVEKVNAKAGHNIDEIELDVHYRVTDARRALGGMPNRSKLQGDVAKDMGQPVSAARVNVEFWEKILGKQMLIETEDAVREVIYQNGLAQNAIEIYGSRLGLAEAVQEQMNERVKRWGVDVTSLEIVRILVNPDIVKGIKKKDGWSDETELKEIEAKREATYIELTGEARAKVEALRVTSLVQALAETGVQLSPEELREIVIDAIRAASESSWESAFGRMNDPVVPPARPATDKQDNGAKK
jgi:regulator of protease activity HflC (stomatin/prohibitin superfamily)